MGDKINQNPFTNCPYCGMEYGEQYIDNVIDNMDIKDRVSEQINGKHFEPFIERCKGCNKHILFNRLKITMYFIDKISGMEE